MKRMMLDLCSGFGGQSEAFLESWAVLRIENNPLLSEVPNTVIADIFDIRPFNISSQRIDYVHASPPCLEFSLAYNAPRSRAERNGEDYHPTHGLAMAKRVKEIIDTLEPLYWSVENVKGSAKYLTPIFGEPRLIVGAYVYYGNFPLFEFDAATIPSKADKDNRRSPLRANYRAHIPLKLSKAFFDAMESQKSIFDY